MMRVFDAAALLGVNAVCGFVGRNRGLAWIRISATSSSTSFDVEERRGAG